MNDRWRMNNNIRGTHSTYIKFDILDNISSLLLLTEALNDDESGIYSALMFRKGTKQIFKVKRFFKIKSTSLTHFCGLFAVKSMFFQCLPFFLLYIVKLSEKMITLRHLRLNPLINEGFWIQVTVIHEIMNENP